MALAPPAEPLRCGWLQKAPPEKGLFKANWKKRWCVLFPRHLVYYENDSEKERRGAIPLELYSVETDGSATVRLVPPTGKRSFVFKAQDEADCQMWVTHLNAVVAGVHHPETFTKDPLTRTVLYAGWVSKLPRQDKGSTKRDKWQDRWLVLEANALFYYGARESDCKGHILLDQMEAAVDNRNGEQTLVISHISGQYSYRFRVEDGSIDQWKAALGGALLKNRAVTVYYFPDNRVPCSLIVTPTSIELHRPDGDAGRSRWVHLWTLPTTEVKCGRKEGHVLLRSSEQTHQVHTDSPDRIINLVKNARLDRNHSATAPSSSAPPMREARTQPIPAPSYAKPAAVKNLSSDGESEDVVVDDRRSVFIPPTATGLASFEPSSPSSPDRSGTSPPFDKRRSWAGGPPGCSGHHTAADRRRAVTSTSNENYRTPVNDADDLYGKLSNAKLGTSSHDDECVPPSSDLADSPPPSPARAASSNVAASPAKASGQVEGAAAMTSQVESPAFNVALAEGGAMEHLLVFEERGAVLFSPAAETLLRFSATDVGTIIGRDGAVDLELTGCDCDLVINGILTMYTTEAEAVELEIEARQK